MEKHQRVLDLYADSDYTLAQIAGLCGISQSTVSGWAKEAGLSLRGRGRDAMKVPTADQQRTLQRLEKHTYQQVAFKLDVSKAYIGHLVQRWRGWIKASNLRIGRDRIKPVKAKEPRQRAERKLHVLSFRLTQAQVDRLTRAVGGGPVKGPCSIHRLARSVVVRALPERAA